MVSVEVLYAPLDGPLLHLNIEVSPGTNVGKALTLSGIYLKHPEASNLPIGIFSKRVTLETPVKTGDRIEIYRPLRIDPKDNRRYRAQEKSKHSKP